MVASRSYIRDGAEIYRNSFAIIRREADLRRFAGHAEKVAVRIIHASGMVEIATSTYPTTLREGTRGSAHQCAHPVRRADGGTASPAAGCPPAMR
jgi:precorrin-8X/cobalt-precorrin-8 methylmutase